LDLFTSVSNCSVCCLSDLPPPLVIHWPLASLIWFRTFSAIFANQVFMCIPFLPFFMVK